MILSKIKTFIDILLSPLIFLFGFLIPKKKNLWVFIGWHKSSGREIFADNSKYMFLHASSKDDVEAVWITEDKNLINELRSRGLKADNIKSLGGILASLRAETTFVDAYIKRSNWRYSGGTKLVQLWHGKGFKKTGYDSLSGNLHKGFKFPEQYRGCDYTIATSPITSGLMSKTFRIPEKNILVTGLPRHDIFFSKIPNAEIGSNPDLRKIFEDKKFNKYILYAPTFRRGVSHPLNRLDLEKLQNYLSDQNALLIIAFHPKYISSTLEGKKFSNITHIKSGYDIYPYADKLDVLITDYSSIFIDFLAIDKHLIFFTSDLKEYKKTPGLYDDYDKLTPGPHVDSTAELIEVLDKKSDWAEERQRAREILFTQLDGNASERIAKFLIK